MNRRMALALAALLPLAALLARPLPARAEEAYGDYLARQSAAAAAADIALPGDAYSAIDMPDAYEPGDGSLYTGASGWVEYTVNAPEDALYAVSLTYLPGDGTGGDIQRSLTLNGETPFEEASSFSLSRMWNDESRDYKLVSGNQPFPSQVETPEWRTAWLTDSLGYADGALLFQLQRGENTVRLTSLREGMFISGITFSAPESPPGYDEYIEGHVARGATRYAGEALKAQAEDAALKSGPSFYPLNDRTSPLTEPYHYSNIVLNTIGGSAWNEPGEWLSWDVEVPESGLYRLAFRFKQSDLRGLYATRKLYINGVLPFSEAADMRFYYDDGWQLLPLGEYTAEGGQAAKEYWFYLEKGLNRLTLEVSLGALGGVLEDLNGVTGDLNALYREIVAITGSSPDAYRDYQLFTRMPELPSRLEALRKRVYEVRGALTKETGSNSERTAGMSRLISLMDEIADDENEVIKRLSAFKECITSIGKSVLDLANQPLRLDYFLVYGEDEPDARADGNFLESAWHAVRAFVGSFTNDYNVSSGNMEAASEIDVWLSTGRDQFDVVRRLINESFETVFGVKVNLKLISADVVLPATATGVGPDVAIQIANSAPVNFAFREAALDLSQFADFDEVAARFHEAALVSFEYEGGVYGLPDQMSFPVMFYREDILEKLGLGVPETWAELIDMIPILERNNMEIYLDTNPAATLGANLSMGNSRAVNTVFLSLLYQNGGDLYASDGERTLMGTNEANSAFKTWTKFYTQHNFPQDIDFATRFRIGEVPIGVVDLSYYNTLTVSAPEIRGDWSIAPVPGTRDIAGYARHDTPCVTSAAMIVRGSVDKNGTREAAWDFLKWWTSEETQTAYAREMEAVLGASGRYLVANLASYEAADWPEAMRQTLTGVLDDLHGIPQVPGGYITGRYLYNAFITVITDYENAADVLFEYGERIDEEIAKKREEFGLPTAAE